MIIKYQRFWLMYQRLLVLKPRAPVLSTCECNFNSPPLSSLLTVFTASACWILPLPHRIFLLFLALWCSDSHTTHSCSRVFAEFATEVAWNCCHFPLKVYDYYYGYYHHFTRVPLWQSRPTSVLDPFFFFFFKNLVGISVSNRCQAICLRQRETVREKYQWVTLNSWWWNLFVSISA